MKSPSLGITDFAALISTPPAQPPMPKEVLYKHDDVSEHTWNVVSHIIAFVCGMIAAALMCLGVR